ncbi:MAG: very short patch repair endonuclease [Pseudomonadota bacterium]
MGEIILVDVFSPAIRSKIMRAIRSKDTEPEMLIRKALHARGMRFRLHVKHLPGSPDLVLPRYKTVIFVNGCFWHGHHCHLSSTPKTRQEFWLGKISNNMNRDRLVHAQLLDAGWRLGVIWECAIKGRARKDFNLVIDELENWLHDSTSLGIEISGKT